jgi:hypothetical protein
MARVVRLVPALLLLGALSASAAAPTDPAGWKQRLTGQLVTQAKTYKTTGPRLDLHLCKGGRFVATMGVPTAPGGQDVRVMDRREGDWDVVELSRGVGITLRYDSGESARHSIQDDGGELMVDGVKWVSEKSPICAEAGAAEPSGSSAK